MGIELTDEQWDELEDKLVKLHNLKENPGTVGEAAAATEAIQRILFKYNISLADIDFNKDNKVIPAKDKHPKATFNFGAKQFLEWRQALLMGIARINFCRAFAYSNRTYAEIVGTKNNVSTVLGMFEYLVKEIRVLCNKGWKSQRASDLTIYGRLRESEGLWRTGFYEGAVDEVIERMQAALDLLKKEAITSGSNALVVQIDAELQEAIYQHFPHMRPIVLSPEEQAARALRLKNLGTSGFKFKYRKVREKKSSNRGYEAGTVAGKTIELNKRLK